MTGDFAFVDAEIESSDIFEVTSPCGEEISIMEACAPNNAIVRLYSVIVKTVKGGEHVSYMTMPCHPLDNYKLFWDE